MPVTKRLSLESTAIAVGYPMPVMFTQRNAPAEVNDTSMIPWPPGLVYVVVPTCTEGTDRSPAKKTFPVESTATLEKSSETHWPPIALNDVAQR